MIDAPCGLCHVNRGALVLAKKGGATEGMWLCGFESTQPGVFADLTLLQGLVGASLFKNEINRQHQKAKA